MTLDLATGLKATMLALCLATVPALPIEPTEPSLSVWGQWGLAGLVVGFVLWRDWQREQALRKEAERQSAWVRTTLLKGLRNSTRAIERIAERPPDEPPATTAEESCA